MLQRLMARLRNIINNQNGSSLIWGVFIFLFVICIFMIFFEKWQLHIISTEVSENITGTLTSTASSNLYGSFVSVREGTSGAYSYNGKDYTEIKDASKFITLFVSIYKETHANGSTIIKNTDGRTVFTVSDIRLFVENASDSTVKSTYMCEYTLTIYQDLLWQGDTIVLDNQRQIVRYKNKF